MGEGLGVKAERWDDVELGGPGLGGGNRGMMRVYMNALRNPL